MSFDRSPSTTQRRRRQRRRRRIGLLLAVLLVIVLGAGIGTIVSDDESDGPDVPVVTVTPTETQPGGLDGTPEDSGSPPTTATPTETTTPDGSGTPDGEGTPTETPARETETATSEPNVGSGSGTGGGGSGGSGGAGGSGGSGGSGGGSGPAVDLQAVGPTAILNYDDVAPDDSGQDELRLRNAGTEEARLFIANVTVTDHENGFVGPEADVDTSRDDGELSEFVELEIEVEYPDRTVDFLYGTDTGARTLAAIANESDSAEGELLGPGEEATVVFDWRVSPSAGNVIQSDGVDFGVTFRLRTD